MAKEPCKCCQPANGVDTVTSNGESHDATFGLAAEDTISRRKLFGWIIAAINLIVGAVVIGPVLGFIGSPIARSGKLKWIDVCPESDLAVGQTSEVSFTVPVIDGYHIVDRKYTIFLRRYEDRIVAFDPACTHLGCRVAWVGDKNRYLCPCHGGVFDADGKVVSGPPPKPLIEYPVRVQDGQVWIQKRV